MIVPVPCSAARVSWLDNKYNNAIFGRINYFVILYIEVGHGGAEPSHCGIGERLKPSSSGEEYSN